eukprot:scaffold110730_cov59-Attheya_sp.AAC.5
MTVLNTLECFQDAGLARDLTDCQCFSAFFHFLCGVSLSCKILKQPTAAAHSTDAELHAMFMAMKCTITFHNFIDHLGYLLPDPT